MTINDDPEIAASCLPISETLESFGRVEVPRHANQSTKAQRHDQTSLIVVVVSRTVERQAHLIACNSSWSQYNIHNYRYSAEHHKRPALCHALLTCASIKLQQAFNNALRIALVSSP